MYTLSWENQKLFIINRELQEMLRDKTIKTVISMSLVHVPDTKDTYIYSAILIYK
jgi:hypothetical protein